MCTVFSGGSDRAVLRNDDLLLLNSECDVSQVLPSCVSDARMMCDGVENCADCQEEDATLCEQYDCGNSSLYFTFDPARLSYV